MAYLTTERLRLLRAPVRPAHCTLLLPPLLSLLLALLLCLAASACAPKEQGADSAATSGVAVTCYPIECLTRRLLQGDQPLAAPCPRDVDPAAWQPDDGALARFQAARLVLANGAGFEAWLGAASLSQSRLIKSAEALRTAWIEYDGVTHSHGGGEHSHRGVDPHTWLDPLNARAQAGAIAAALERAWPELKPALTERQKALEGELLALHEGWRSLAPRLIGARLLAAHPAYGYLAKRHGLSIADAALDPEQDLDSESRQRLSGLRGAGPALLWFESEPKASLRAALEAEFDLRVLVVSPGEQPGPEQQDYLEIQRGNLTALEAALASLGL
jgi:ABC-type Zn uptake system ZnuABC Zn-binding protein ZnuA